MNIKKFDNNVYYYISTKDINAPYENSLALHTNQEAIKIIQNRENLNLPSGLKFIVANQTHSDNVIIIKNNQSQGWNDEISAIKDCDSLITNLPNIALTILTADCVPILIYDRDKKVISAVHSGWRGTKKRILKKTISKMIMNFNSNIEDIEVFIAPSIRGCCYEVNWEVAKEFNKYIKIEDKYMLDLAKINHSELIEMGIKNIKISPYCTSCDNDKFFSYRKEKGCNGRFMSIIWIAK
ncbi:COG1496: Uncharacterized conserved protein [hydrothermal vent metagenome]|uniref:COG1496: Uncharacterized conserved protein n=1 Tax=hydrothermal vent metagenome TaxID=652676 RepID=A0A1W1EIG2_9ZZZZ